GGPDGKGGYPERRPDFKQCRFYGWLDRWLDGQTERKRPKPEVVKNKFELQDGRCMYCGHKLNRANMDVDHKKPLKHGGSNSPANIQLLCRPCNGIKGTMNDKPFRRQYKLDLDAKVPPARAIPYSYFDKIKASKPKVKRKHPF
ncbi:HNH endonuclease, partial [Chloroflexota bacterium]